MPAWEYCSLGDTGHGLVCTIYRAKRFTMTLIYQGEDTDNALASYITRLDLLGWEAVQATLPNDRSENWRFKRSIHPGNHSLNWGRVGAHG